MDNNDSVLSDFDAVLQDNRVRDSLETIAGDNPMVHFAPVSSGDPWKRGAGMFKDDPYFDVWQESIREYRRQREAEDALEDELASVSAKKVSASDE